MTPELEAYYEARFVMFSSQGWKDLMDDIEAMKEATDTVKGCDDLRKLGVKQGEVSIMDWLLGLKELSEKAYEDLKNETVA